MESTNQEKFWKSDFGKEYTDRNNWKDDEDWDKVYVDTWGLTKLEINDKILKDLPRDIKILEVGCNYGAQLRGFQRMGFENLYGIELQPYAVEKSKQKFSGLNIISGSGFDLPFKDGFFDLVCTNGVLIHISPKDNFGFMKEIHRCSKKYIMGWEYYDNETKELNYRDNQGFMWKADYASIYQKNFPDLQLKDEHFVKYLANDNRDSIFLLEKK
ncbi:pseudaminic acid biosynthesis-associated methylase [Terrimonas pollutisoli]|uniref:pseudaminic acid biosynthesis-associated methylase n=1 Tax=Terrimonas pollutisoli TaxID=3034147 RepID=UPI0023EB323D|nr:pseudaminic acid biosynthesis-associated methylase [Terrimonas sp. H1YJ31]